MGLLGDWFRSKRMRDPVRGTAQVVGASRAPDGAQSANLHMTLVVAGAGVPSQTVEHACMCPVKRWPWPGMTLPVTFDREDPTRLHVDWNEVPTAKERARQQGEALVASRRGGAPAPEGGDLAQTLMGLVGSGDAAEITHWGGTLDLRGDPEMRKVALDSLSQHSETLRRQGVDVEAIMDQVGGAGGATQDGGAGQDDGADAAERLRRIDELHRGGTISGAERDRLRQRILDSL